MYCSTNSHDVHVIAGGDARPSPPRDAAPLEHQIDQRRQLRGRTPQLVFEQVSPRQPSIVLFRVRLRPRRLERVASHNVEVMWTAAASITPPSLAR
jgi:hypothetical protein